MSNSNPDAPSETGSSTVSNVTSLHGDLSQGPELEVDAGFGAGTDAPALETDPIEEAGADRKEASPTTTSDAPDAGSARDAETGRKKGRLLAVVLGLLLLVSLAVNLLQARTTARLDARSREFEAALNEAVAVIDQETLRANAAESTIAGIEGAAETVRERIDSLQQALDDLQRVTRPEAAAAE